MEPSKIIEVRPSRAGRRSKTLPEVPIIFRVSCSNPQSRQSMVLGLGIVEGRLGTWVSLKRCSLFQDRKILSLLTRNVLRSANPDFESTIDSQSWDSSFAAKTITASILACLCGSASSQQINSSQFFNFLAIFCLIFSEEFFLNSNSPYKLSLSL